MRYADTKERILHAALNQFSRSGYDSVGIDEIAEEAGVKGPSLYRHFKGKLDILNVLIGRIENYYREKIIEPENADFSPASLQELRSYSMGQILVNLEDATMVKIRRLLTKEQFRDSRIGHLASENFHLQIEAHYRSIFSRMIEKGLLKPYDPAILAMEYVFPVAAMICLCDREPARREELMEKILAHITHFLSVYGV